MLIVLFVVLESSNSKWQKNSTRSDIIRVFQVQMCFSVAFARAVIMCCPSGSTVVGTNVWSAQRSRLCGVENELDISTSEEVSDSDGGIIMMLPILFLFVLLCMWVALYNRSVRQNR